MKEGEIRRTAAKNLKEYAKGLKENAEVFRWIWDELISAVGFFWIKRFLALQALSTCFQIGQPYFVIFIFSGLVSQNDKLVFLGFGGWLFCEYAHRKANLYLMKARESALNDNLGKNEERITELLFEKSMGQHLREGSSLNASNIDKGRNRVIDTQRTLFFSGAQEILALFLSYAFLWFISPTAGLIMTAVVLPHLAWSLYLNQRVNEVCDPIDREFRALNRHRLDRWEKIERVKSCGKEAEELGYMNGEFREIISKDQKFWFKFIDQIHKRGWLSSLGNFAIMAYGAWLVRKGYWADVGILYPLYSWSERITQNLWQIGHLEHQINWNMPSIKSMIRALAIPPDITDKEDAKVILPGEPLKIEFENVSYSYPSAVLPDGKSPEQEQATVKNISFDIAPGEKVALVGQSGAGKTTVMRLLLRFMDPSSGSIKVNGTDLREIRQESWMRVVGYIPQHPQIFDGTIRYNLAYGLLPEEKEAAADEELGELARRLGIEFKNRNGLDTVVGRNGVKLSGGEAQRLIVGAALAKKPILMVVDEATSNLDSITEKEIQKCFAKALAGNKSALVVAHRLSTVRNICEKFIVLRAPQESENGSLQIEAVASSFEELYKISPTFRRLADAQGVIIG